MAECSGGSGRVSPEKSSETDQGDQGNENMQPESKPAVEEELYEVEKIVGTTKANGQILYKVRWRGYSPQWDTFEPVENLQSCLDLIDEYQQKKEELKRKRTLERKRRKAMMEGRALPELTDVDTQASVASTMSVSSNADLDTLKDTFWRDLEQGKVNLFETDMYSKVKGQGRASRPTSFKFRDGRRKADNSDEKDGDQQNSQNRSKTCVRGSGKRLGVKKRKPRIKKKAKSKPVTAFDRAQLDCHNGINTPESLCKVLPGRSGTLSMFYKDTYVGQKVKSPVPLTSELMVKVERISVGQELHSPLLTPSNGIGESSNSTDCEGPSNTVTHTEGSTQGATTDGGRSETSCTTEKADGKMSVCQSQRVAEDEPDVCTGTSIKPKRPSVCEDLLGGKKIKVMVDMWSGCPLTCSSHNLEAVNSETNPRPPAEDKCVKTTISAIKETNCHGVPVTTCMSAVATADLSINSKISVTSPTCIDKSDMSCIQSTISEGSDLESSSRGDKFGEISPPTDSGEDSMKGEEDGNAFSVAIVGTKLELDDIDPEGYDREAARMKANPEVLELSERKFQDVVSDGDYEKVKKALNSGRTYNLGSIDATGMTLLMYAAQRGYDDIAELLVSHGARINAQQRNGTTALMLACEHSQLCTVVLFVELGASLNLQQTSGETALMKAVKRGSKQIVRFLLERGANFAAQTITGNSAMTYAKMLHVCDVEDMLFDHVARLSAEFDRQVAVTINNTAKILCALFPLQCFPLCDGNKFVIHFKHELQPITPGVGYLLFVAHTRITPQEIKCRFYGPCAVTNVMLNGVVQPSLTEVGMKAEANFVLSCCPLNNGKNELIINTTSSPTSKAKLVVCAYKAKLME